MLSRYVKVLSFRHSKLFSTRKLKLDESHHMHSSSCLHFSAHERNFRLLKILHLPKPLKYLITFFHSLDANEKVFIVKLYGEDEQKQIRRKRKGLSHREDGG
jgi:hypothetical protein